MADVKETIKFDTQGLKETIDEFSTLKVKLEGLNSSLKAVNQNIRTGVSAEAFEAQRTAISNNIDIIARYAEEFNKLKSEVSGVDDTKIKRAILNVEAEFKRTLYQFNNLDASISATSKLAETSVSSLVMPFSELGNKLKESNLSLQQFIASQVGLKDINITKRFTSNYAVIARSVSDLQLKLSDLQAGFQNAYKSETFAKERNELDELMASLSVAKNDLLGFIDIEKQLNDGFISPASQKAIQNLISKFRNLGDVMNKLDIRLATNLGSETLGESFSNTVGSDATRHLVETINNELKSIGSDKSVENKFESFTISANSFNEEIQRGIALLKQESKAVREYNLESSKSGSTVAQSGVSVEQALLELEQGLTDEQRRYIALKQEAVNKQKEEINSAADLSAAYRQHYNIVNKEKEARAELKRRAEELNRENELGLSIARSYNNELKKAHSNMVFELEFEAIKEDASAIKSLLDESLRNNDISGVRAAISDMESLKNRANEFRNSLSGISTEQSLAIGASGMISDIDSVFESMRGSASEASEFMRKSIESKLKSGFSVVLDSAKKSISTIYKFAKKSVTTAVSFIKKTLNALIDSFRGKFSGLFNITGGSRLSSTISQLKSMISMYTGIYAILRGIKSSIGFASDLVEIENVVLGSFESMSSAIDEWAENTASKFGLTALQAKDFAGTFGSIAKGFDLTNEQSVILSKNLTALAGDLASFRNLDAEDTFIKLQSAFSGNVQALRQLGITVTKSNLKNFAKETYGVVYTECNNATQAMIRYNYIMNQARQMNIMGDFAGTTMSWANQTRLLINNLKLLGGYIGGIFIKVLYPVVQVLNAIVEASLKVMAVLGKLFGFDLKGLQDIFGGEREYAPDIDGLEDESDALDDVSESAKNASDNLQGFDKLNNMVTTKSKSNSNKAGIGVDIPLDSYEDLISQKIEIPKWLEDFKNWLDEFGNLLLSKDWVGAGKHLADGLNYITDSLYNLLTSKEAYAKISSFNDAITDFYFGLLKYDTNKLGKTFGAAINLVSFGINDLYDKAVRKNLLKKTGEKIADFFLGLDTEVDWYGLGQAFTTGFRASMDILAGFLEKAQSSDLANRLGNDIKMFLLGAIDRLFGNNGAEEIGKNIAGVVNFALELVSGALGDGSVITNLANGVVTVINTAISTISSDDLKNALSSLLNLFGSLFSMLGDIDTDTLSDKIADAINGAVDNGSVSNLASGITSAIVNLFNLIGKTIDKVDKSELAGAILKGIGDGLKSTEGEKYIVDAFTVLFGVNLLAQVGRFGLNILGRTIVELLASHIAGTSGVGIGRAIASTVSSSASQAGVAASGLGTTVAKKFNLAFGAALAVVGIIATQIGNARKDVDEWFKELDDRVNDVKSSIEETGKLELFDTSSVEMESFSEGIGKVAEGYNKLNDSMKLLATQVDSNNPLNKIEASSQGLLNSDKIFEALSLTIDGLTESGYNNKEVMDKLKDFYENGFKAGETDEVLKLIGVALQDTQSASEALIDSLENGSEGAEKFANSFKGGIYDVCNTTKNELSNLSSDITNMSDDFANSGRAVTLDMLSSMSSTIDTDTTVSSSLGNNIKNAESMNKPVARSSGVSLTLDELSAMSTTIDSDNTVSSSTSALLNRAESSNGGVAKLKGSLLSNKYIDGMSGIINTDVSVISSTNSLLNRSASSVAPTARFGGTSVGKNVLAGIGSGLNDSSEKSSLGSAIGSIANWIVSKFKDILGIHSPSRVFAKESKFIPEGIREGIEDNEDVAVDEMTRLSDLLVSNFKLDTFDLSEMLDIEKFSSMLGIAEKETDVFSKSMRDKLSSIQTDMVVQPSFRKSEMDSLIAQQSTNAGVANGLSNIYAKLGNISQGSNKPVHVSVYLDQNNKLSDFIIDTVNGNVIRGGSF